jgi:ABC-type transport system substrate-binding protein
MTFSDGTPITPDVIIDNFNRWFDPQDALHGNGDYAAWQEIFLGFHGEKDADERAKSSFDGIQKVDQNTVLIHLNRVMPDLLKDLAQPAFAILDPAALADGGYGTREHPVISSGPYMVTSWTEDGLLLSPNAQYWGELPQEDLQFGW